MSSSCVSFATLMICLVGFEPSKYTRRGSFGDSVAKIPPVNCVTGSDLCHMTGSDMMSHYRNCHDGM